MPVEYTWGVAQMDCYPEADGESDVVFTVHWVLSATDGTYSAGAYGTSGFSVDPDEPFTPYADLTLDQVIGWVKNSMGDEQVSSLEVNLANQIEAQVIPPVVTPPLPWGNLDENPILP